MSINPVTLVLVLAFVYPIVKGFLFKFSSNNLKNDIRGMGSNIAFIIALFLGMYFAKEIFMEHDSVIYTALANIIPAIAFEYIEANTIVYYVVIVPIMVFCFYKITNIIIDWLSRITLYPMINALEKGMENKSNIFKRIAGVSYQMPRAIGYVLFITLILNILTTFNVQGKYSKYLEDSKPYNFLCREVVIPVTNSSFARELPKILNNSLKVVVKDVDVSGGDTTALGKSLNRKVIVYYNGVTLEEGIKSNSSIDSFAKELAVKGNTSKEKARIIYNWIGTNISYDYNKAESVLNNNFEVKSGAIPTFQSRKGICFDYACLYVAMARANGLKVRIITGEGFNGVSWVSHAWNQVYISEEDEWINVDPTFYKGGNYFNSKRFDKDHKNSTIADEW